MLDVSDIIQITKHYFLANIKSIIAVYLFGSYNKGKARPNSDVDLAVVLDDRNPYDRFEAKLAISSALEGILGMKVDVVDLMSADPYFIHQVFLTCQLVFEGDLHKRVAFEVEQRRMYQDMLPFYELYYRKAMERIQERGAK